MTALVGAMAIPWVAGIVLVVADGRRPVVRWAGVAALVATIAFLTGLAGTVLTDGPVRLTTGDWPAGVGITLRADALGVTFALLSVVMLTAAALHQALAAPGARETPGIVLLLAAGLIGTFLTGDVFNFYVFFELALAASYVLVVDGSSRRVLGAGLVFIAVNLLGTFVFLLSVAGLYRVTATLDMVRIAERMAMADPNAAILIAVGFFVAFSVKLGLFPFHFWLPTVYTGTPPAVAAILSGSLANIGAYGLLRFGGDLLPRELELAAGALIVIGAISILYGGILAVSRRTSSEMLAYSAIGQVGYVLVAIGVGGPVGFAAAILYTIINAANKTMLFLATRVRGVLIGGLVALGALSIAGVPPAAGFIGKLGVFRAIVDEPVLVAVVLLGSLLSLVYAFQTYQFEHWRPAGEAAGDSASAGTATRQAPDRPTATWRGQLVPMAIGLGILGLGLWPEPLLALSDAAAAALTGARP
jgi:multicomponent Na+:H+ antiporter subunit D